MQLNSPVGTLLIRLPQFITQVGNPIIKKTDYMCYRGAAESIPTSHSSHLYQMM